MSDSTGPSEPTDTSPTGSAGPPPGSSAQRAVDPEPTTTKDSSATRGPQTAPTSKRPKIKKPPTPEQLERRRTIIRFAVFVGVGAVATVLLYFLLSALIPRWWSQLIGRQVGGRISNGILLGLIYGFVFSFLPLMVLAQARHRAFGWPAKGLIVLIAAVLTAPNLMTLGIAIGQSPAAQAGDRTMDVTAPGFRYASLWGVVLGVIAAIVVVAVSILWERRSRELKLLRARVDQLERELPSALPLPPGPPDRRR